MSPPPAGRPRDPAVEASVLAATLAALAEAGPGRLSVRAVAAQAGVARTTLYRRWPSKESLLAAALAHTFRQQGAPPDTGSVRDDLLALCQARARLYRSRAGRWILPTMADLLEADAVGRAVGEATRSERAPFAEVVRRGVRRGEFGADVKAATVVELLVGALTARLLARGPLGGSFTADVVDHVLRGLGPMDASGLGAPHAPSGHD